MSSSVRVWDRPTRWFHWSLATLFLVSWLSAENDLLDVHFYSGYALLTLLLFRFAWGFVGTSTARFSHFLTAPWRGLAHLPSLWRANAQPGHGHSPSGGWMVMILLGALLTQATMGLFATDELLHVGPLSDRVGSGTAETLTEWHETLGEALPWLIGLHVAAVLWIVFRQRHPLIGAMVSGRRSDLPAEMDAHYRPAPAIRAFIVLAIAASSVTAIVLWG